MRHKSELLEEAEECVGRAVASLSCACRCGFRDRALLDREVSVEIDLGRLHRLMAEPESHDGAIDTAVQEQHRARMAKHVRRDLLGGKRGALLRGAGAMDFDEML